MVNNLQRLEQSKSGPVLKEKKKKGWWGGEGLRLWKLFRMALKEISRAEGHPHWWNEQFVTGVEMV